MLTNRELSDAEERRRRTVRDLEAPCGRQHGPTDCRRRAQISYVVGLIRPVSCHLASTVITDGHYIRSTYMTKPLQQNSATGASAAPRMELWNDISPLNIGD
ncbi:unnamed protein product [Amoebophrya sp. A25]|nr:unnamed protein product [Amoebophrya sp. A25]|eukprot:GSA25T00017809001.1